MNRNNIRGMTNNLVNNNNLVNKFNSYVNNNVPFQKNPILNNNPTFMTNSRDSSFYNKINLAKIEQIKRAKNIDDIGFDKKKLTNMIICPITINKTNKKELDEAYNDIIPQYEKKNNKILEEWWKTRTNQPYKNVIKKELFNNKQYKKFYKDDIFNTNFKSKDELLVHKVTSDDYDELLLEAEFELLNDIIEKHNDELKVIYSSSKKNHYKKEFEYVQNYRYRLEYNPKNSEELKDFYKKEQKKINKEKKMIDDVISTLIENDELTKEEIEKINKEIEEETKKSKKSSKLDNIEYELRKELGEDYEDIIDSIIVDSDEEQVNKSKSKTKSISVKTVKEKTEDANLKSPTENFLPQKKSAPLYSEKPKKKIKVKTIKNNDNSSDDNSIDNNIDNNTIHNNSNDNNIENNDEKINTENLKDKYRNRK
jgi:hypothetical protein